MSIEDIETQAARFAHEVHRALRAALGESEGPAWEELTGVEHIAAICAVASLLSNGDVGAEARHRAWLARRVEAGWRYAEREDRARRLSPCMRPWAALAPADRAKDAVWLAAVRGMVEVLRGSVLLSSSGDEPLEDAPPLDAPEAASATPIQQGGEHARTVAQQPSRAERRAAQRKGR